MLEIEKRESFTVLHSFLRAHNLDYKRLRDLSAPLLPIDKGVILNGKLPLWLASSLAMFYQHTGVPWIAGYYPQKQGAVIVYSRNPKYAPGDLIPIAFDSHNY